MKRMILAAAVATVALSATVRADAPERPNILFILSDDYGIDGVSCYGSDRFKDKTPNLDALAKSGIRFEQCYSTPLCGPSRCTLMTGRYGFRTGGLTNPTAHRPSFKDEPSVAKALKQAGYATGMAGKWRQMGDTPGDWGFDEYITDPTAGGWYWQKSYTKNGNPRDWAFVQLDARWYVRDAGWKLNQSGELFDMADAPFVEKPVMADSQDEKAKAARQRLQAVLDKLNPAAGKTVPPEEKRATKAARKAKRAEKKKSKQADAAAK